MGWCFNEEYKTHEYFSLMVDVNTHLDFYMKKLFQILNEFKILINFINQ